jgi:hypothetical protein
MTRFLRYTGVPALVAVFAVLAGAAPASASAQSVDGVTCSSSTWEYSKHFNDPPVVSGPITCSPVGGVAPFTYAWIKDSGDAGTRATNPNGATSSFQRSLPRVSTFVQSHWHVTITDATGSSASSASILVTFEFENGD